MAVTPAAMLRPAGGELDASAFALYETEAELLALLGVWLEAGVVRAETAGVLAEGAIDAVSAHHAYARAYDTLWTRTPLANASASLDGLGSKAQGADQRAVWKAKRDEHEAALALAIATDLAAQAEDATTTASGAAPRGSASKRFYVQW